MYRIILTLALAGALSACTTDGGGGGDDNPLNTSDADAGIGEGEQPLVPEPPSDDSDDDGSTTEPPPDPDNNFGEEASDELVVNDMSFDPATGELVLNNAPFDGDDNIYTEDAATTAAIRARTGTGFGMYNNAEGVNSYYAVFRRSPNDYSQVAALGTDSYVSFGFGGVGVQRLSGSGALPSADESYLFTGEYAAVRTVLDDTTGSQVQYVAGTAIIDVDIEDFDVNGAVEGLIVNREFFEANGVRITDLDRADYISLATAQINFDEWTINSSTATAISGTEAGATGTWEGLFAGPNGEEVAGFVFVEGQGPVGIDPATGDYEQVEVREVGTFIGTR